MANALNDFYVNLGTSIDAKIPKSNHTFYRYLKNPNTSSMFLRETDFDEIQIVLNNLNVGKACGPNNIPTNLLKDSSVFLSPIFVKIINKSFHEGVFPTLLKHASVCPIYKKKD